MADPAAEATPEPAACPAAVIHRPSNIEDQLEAKCKSEGSAWYPCKVVEIIDNYKVIVQFEDDDQEAIDPLKSLRFAAVPMEPCDCPLLVAGHVVCGFNKREDLDQWFNAQVISVDRKDHDEDGECRCQVTVNWLEGRFRNQRDTLTADFIALPQSGDEASTGPCCSLCQKTRCPVLGPVLQVDEGGSTYGLHELCIAWAPDVYKNIDDDEDTWRGVGEAVERGSKIKCAKCKRPGANLACFDKSGCKTTTSTSFVSKSYHYPCALDLPGAKLDQGKMEFYCPKHAGKHLKAKEATEKAEAAAKAKAEKAAAKEKEKGAAKARPVKELKRKRVAGGAPTPSGSPEEDEEGKAGKHGRGKAAGGGRAKVVAEEIEDEATEEVEDEAIKADKAARKAADKAAEAERRRKHKAWVKMNSENSVKVAEEERRLHEEEEAARLEERITSAMAHAAAQAAAMRAAMSVWECAIDNLTATARKAKREGCEIAKAAMPDAKAAVQAAKAAELEAIKASKEASGFVDILKNTQFTKSIQRKERERKEGAGGAGGGEPAAWFEREKAERQRLARERVRAKKIEEERRREEQRRQFEAEEAERVKREKEEREKENQRRREKAAAGKFDKAAWARYQAESKRFSENVPAVLTFDAIPWPPSKFQFRQALENGLWGGSIKKGLLVYHTDKVLAGHVRRRAASDAERERMENELNDITVQLNLLKATYKK